MKRLCQDYNISPIDRDNIYIVSTLKCDYVAVNGWSKKGDIE